MRTSNAVGREQHSGTNEEECSERSHDKCVHDRDIDVKEEQIMSLKTVRYSDREVIDSILHAIHILKLRSAQKRKKGDHRKKHHQ
jgi:hypothetical protein